jgi:plasmid maintenance system antidote protein VapI
MDARLHKTGRLSFLYPPSTLTRIINQRSGISPEMALRLSKALGRSPESWLTMQHNDDLYQAKKVVDLSEVQMIEFDAA